MSKKPTTTTVNGDHHRPPTAAPPPLVNVDHRRPQPPLPNGHNHRPLPRPPPLHHRPPNNPPPPLSVTVNVDHPPPSPPPPLSVTAKPKKPPTPSPSPSPPPPRPLSVTDHPPLPPPPYRHQYPQPTNHSSSSSSSNPSFKGCCCWLLLLLAFLSLLLLAAFLVIVFAVKPKKPQFDLQQVGVQYRGIDPAANPAAFADAAASTAAAATLSLNIRLLFMAVNPNKVGIKYSESRFTVMYKGIPLGEASVPPFYQEQHSSRQVEANIAVDRVNLLQADAADIVREASLNDRVELRVLGYIGAKIRVLDFDSPGVQVSVDCGIVISPRKQSLTYKQCGFDGLSV